jgi:nucleotidyltransferase/DNA polymerase involved in DNA repair
MENGPTREIIHVDIDAFFAFVEQPMIRRFGSPRALARRSKTALFCDGPVTRPKRWVT